jgi:hypothetical protein
MTVKSAFSTWFATSVHRLRRDASGTAELSAPVMSRKTNATPAATKASHTRSAAFVGCLAQALHLARRARQSTVRARRVVTLKRCSHSFLDGAALRQSRNLSFFSLPCLCVAVAPWLSMDVS